jgi:hypothetical protein
MILPDISTLVIIVASLTWSLFLAWRVYSTKRIIKEWERNGPLDRFVIARRNIDRYGSVLEPLFVLFLYLGIYVLVGSPSWNTDYGFQVDAPMFCLAIISSWIFLVIFISAYIEASEFFIVSNDGIERYLGPRVRSAVRWEDVTCIWTNTGLSPESGRFRSISVFKGKKGFGIEKNMTNVDRFYHKAVEKLPQSIEDSDTIAWMQRKLNEKAA